MSLERKAKEICALLITRGIQNLDEDQEFIIDDYFDELGIELDLDTDYDKLCRDLLRKAKIKDGMERAPLPAYAHSLLSKGKEMDAKKELEKQRKFLNIKRRQKIKDLVRRSRNLEGCKSAAEMNDVYSFVVNPDVGIKNLPTGDQQYEAFIRVPADLYTKIMSDYDSPVFEINYKNNLGYGRIEGYHENGDVIYISPLIQALLESPDRFSAVGNLCRSMPTISKIRFTYYGTRDELSKILPKLTLSLPHAINAFSYLSLGMVLKTAIDGSEQEVRVDALRDINNTPIFSGIIPLGDSDIPFEIDPEE